MVEIEENFSVAAPADEVWRFISNPEAVAACIPGATLSEPGGDGSYKGSMKIKFGPTVAVFRGEVKLKFDDAEKRCTIEGKGLDQKGMSRASASGLVTVTGQDRTDVRVAGKYDVSGPLEMFAKAGGVHVARAILSQFAENMERALSASAPADDTAAASQPPAPPQPAEARPISVFTLAWQVLRSFLKSLTGRR